MKKEIERFCDEYSGTAIGEETRNRLDNAEDSFDVIEGIYNELEEVGYI